MLVGISANGFGQRVVAPSEGALRLELVSGWGNGKLDEAVKGGRKAMRLALEPDCTDRSRHPERRIQSTARSNVTKRPNFHHGTARLSRNVGYRRCARHASTSL